ncbi:MAG: hypothetical protein V3V47_01920, partial [Desulfobacteria bacterium]
MIFVPRNYQRNLWDYMLKPGLRKRASVRWHRRAGKDLTAISLIAEMAKKRIGDYWHLFPEGTQGRRIAWEGMTDGKVDRETGEPITQGIPFLDFISPVNADGERPEEKSRNNQNMKLRLNCGSSYQVLPANRDSLVGGNPLVVVFSEWSIMDPDAWEFIRPILTGNKGAAIFIGTPRGNNHAAKMHSMAVKS